MTNKFLGFILFGIAVVQTNAEKAHWLVDAGVSFSQSGLYDDENSGLGINASFAYIPRAHWATGVSLLHFDPSNLIGRVSDYSTTPFAFFGNYHFVEINNGAFFGPILGLVLEERVSSRDGPDYLALRPGLGVQGGYNFKVLDALSVGPSAHFMMVFGKAASYTFWALGCKASLNF